MAGIKKVILIMSAFVIISIGFLGPDLISRYQDESGENQPEIIEMDKMSITVGKDIYSVLDLINQPHTLHDNPDEISMYTPEEIFAKEKAVLNELAQQIPICEIEKIDKHSESKKLAVTNYQELYGYDVEDNEIGKALVWECYMSTSNKVEIKMIIDDNSGKVTNISICRNKETSDKYIIETDAQYQAVISDETPDYYEFLEKFYQDYYECEIDKNASKSGYGYTYITLVDDNNKNHILETYYDGIVFQLNEVK